MKTTPLPIIKCDERWIWLPKNKYPDCQTTCYTTLVEKPQEGYAVAEFRREYRYDKQIVKAELRFSGDSSFVLYGNGELIATGPASVGGDFFGNGRVRDNFYAYRTELPVGSASLTLFARVQMRPVQICEYSKGHGGFMLSGVVTFEDGTRDVITTDESWQARKCGAYTAPRTYDGTILPEPYVNAEVTENIWRTEDAPIPPRTERELFPEGCRVTLAAGERLVRAFEFDMIYAGFVKISVKAEGRLTAKLRARELCEEDGFAEEVTFVGDGEYRSFALYSAGNILANIENLSDAPAEVCVSLVSTHYPVTETAATVTSDEELNRVLRVAEHTLKYCRQSHHLDSPKHVEPLACTGDYYIETMMTMFSFGDMRLSEFDIIRTAELLEREGGRMFHTTYSLIWVRMLYDVYMATGNRALLERCEPALMTLLRRFDGYIGDNGIIENPPDYMFVDWIYIDEISMHHPPKCLGQSSLNMFYYGALTAAESIYLALGEECRARVCRERSFSLKKAINLNLFDPERQTYFEGLNTPTRADLIGEWMPENTGKRYYLKHSNILAACFGVCEGELARSLIDKIMSDEIEGDYQPYFAHFLLEAVYNAGLREKYTLSIIDKWRAPIRECSKGLVEGFIPPEPTYSFDHSHAWGGTPLYSLPRALLGLDGIEEAGMTSLRINPSLLGLNLATVELPTPYGKLTCEMRKGRNTVIKHPEAVRLRIPEGRADIVLKPY